jgi:phage-related protein
MGDSLTRLRLFSKAVRQQVGFELEMVQRGGEPTDWKPMPAIGAGVNEIRVRSRGEVRVFYVAKFRRAVYVLHAFAKKTQATPRSAIQLAAERYRQVVRMEKELR